MSEPIKSLNKLLVDVPKGKGQDFLNTYGPGAQNRKPDYDNKVVFLHDTHTIFTQNDVFGGTEVTVGSNNSFAINGTAYTLTINNGELNIDPYRPSSLMYAYFNIGSSSATPDQSREYNTSYDDITVTVTPSNVITYSINNGTAKILLVGIQGKNENSYTYLYGDSYTMTGNMVTKIGSKTITEADYKNANITGTLTIPTSSSANAGTVTNTHNSGTATTNFTITATTTTQTGVVYYHELGKTGVYKTGFTANTPTTKSSTVTVYKGHFVWVAEEYLEPTITTGITQKPSSITTHQGAESEGKYAWFATTAAPTYEGSTYKKPVFNDGKYDGGWEPYKENGVVKTFTHYGDTYYVYKTKNVGLGDVTWTITY